MLGTPALYGRKCTVAALELGNNYIKVNVTGGKLLGLGSACPFYPESYLDPVTDTYYGEALAVILPEGDMTITADDGTHHAEISLPIA